MNAPSFPRAERFSADATEAVVAAIRNERLSDTAVGKHIARVEQVARLMCGTRRALSTNSGTSAIHAALWAVQEEVTNVPRVVVSPLTWESAYKAPFHLGGYPIWCDASHNGQNVNSWSLDRSVLGRATTYLHTHLWGAPSPVPPELAALVPVVEDCSHAHGATINGQSVGKLSLAGAFSFQDSKVSSAGEGGMLVTDHEEVYQRAMSRGHHPSRLSMESIRDEGAGHKYRMPVISAILAYDAMYYLESRQHIAQMNADLLRDLLIGTPEVKFIDSAPGEKRAWYGCALRVEADIGRTFAGALRQRGVKIRGPYRDIRESNLLNDRKAIRSHWPYVDLSGYTTPQEADLSVYGRILRSVAVVALPDCEADEYVTWLAQVIRETLRGTAL